MSEVGRIPKPKLRGLHVEFIKKSLGITTLVCTALGLALKFGHNEPRKRDYAEFYKTYDDNAAFERMRKAGVLQSCK
ncbi:cytochrome c oxidase subunit 6C-like [Culicoides brevitarsis]|uniref:cytochrome c oxidase subunit 6C-like n=1 Tax=Culicoides brevitarsis TaxID=469753 RepID=UPI00307BA33C